MSTNTDTVLKLSDALTELITAYEKLQQQNDDLEAKNKALQDELDSIKEDKASLEDNFNELNESSEKQENNISSMLGKIESLLGGNKSGNSKKELQDIVVDEPKEEELEESVAEAIELEENIFNTPAQHEVSSDVSDLNLKGSDNIDISIAKVEESNLDTKTNDENKEEDDNKLDLNRMASLLNGFNK